MNRKIGTLKRTRLATLRWYVTDYRWIMNAVFVISGIVGVFLVATSPTTAAFVTDDLLPFLQGLLPS